MSRVKILCPTCDGTCTVFVESNLIDCPTCDGKSHIWVDRGLFDTDFGAWLVVTAITVLVIFAIAMVIATPRSTPDPTIPDPGASGADVASGGATPARALEDTSGPGSTGAPLVSDGVTTTAPGGVPLPDTATAEVRGTATWLCDPPRYPRCTHGYGEGSFVAAAGSEIKRWRGRMVRVWSAGHHVDVRLVDACGCKGSRVIDLYAIAFRKLAPQGAGEIFVTVELLGRRARGMALPPTDTVR